MATQGYLMIDPFDIFKGMKTKPVTAATRIRVRDLEQRQGRLVRMGRKKNAPLDIDGKDLVEWVRRNRFS